MRDEDIMSRFQNEDGEINWAFIRDLWESHGWSYKQIMETFGIPKSTLGTKRKNEGWEKKNPIDPLVKTPIDKAVEKQEKELGINGRTRAKVPSEFKELTVNEKNFVEELMICHMPNVAFRKAFHRAPVSHAEPYRLLNKAGVRRYMEELQLAVSQTFSLQLHNVVQEYTELAFADLGDWVDWGTEEIKETVQIGENEDGTGIYEQQVVASKPYVRFKNEGERPANTRVIQEVKMGKDGISIKLFDRTKALDKLIDFFKHSQMKELQELQAEKMRLEIEIMKKEGHDPSKSQVVIVNAKDEMMRVLEERRAKAIEMVQEFDQSQVDS